MAWIGMLDTSRAELLVLASFGPHAEEHLGAIG